MSESEKQKDCDHRFKTLKKNKKYQCRKCGKVNAGAVAQKYKGKSK